MSARLVEINKLIKIKQAQAKGLMLVPMHEKSVCQSSFRVSGPNDFSQTCSASVCVSYCASLWDKSHPHGSLANHSITCDILMMISTLSSQFCVKAARQHQPYLHPWQNGCNQEGTDWSNPEQPWRHPHPLQNHSSQDGKQRADWPNPGPPWPHSHPWKNPCSQEVKQRTDWSNPGQPWPHTHPWQNPCRKVSRGPIDQTQISRPLNLAGRQSEPSTKLRNWSWKGESPQKKTKAQVWKKEEVGLASKTIKTLPVPPCFFGIVINGTGETLCARKDLSDLKDHPSNLQKNLLGCLLL